MLSNISNFQHAALRRPYVTVAPRGGKNLRLPHRCCPTVQPSRPPGLLQVLASSDKTSSSSRYYSNSFFGRKLELQYLKKLCECRPHDITVILGPPDSGKTALLQEYICNQDQGSTGSRCLIDARVTPVTSPDDLAKALMDYAIPGLARQLFPDRHQLQKAAETCSASFGGLEDKLQLGDAAEIDVNSWRLAPILEALTENTGEVPPLGVVTQGYVALLDAWYQARAIGHLKDAKLPVLVLDEANVLMTWGDQYKVGMKILLNLFVAISKQQNRCHVLLVTSDHSFLPWLTKEIGPLCASSDVIGDFPEQEAQEFFAQCLHKVGEPGVSDAEWKAVYEVCGGSPGALKRAAGNRHLLGSWKEALSQVTRTTWHAMEDSGRYPAPDAGYTAADYAIAVAAILDSPYKVVDEDDLRAKLGREALEAMVQAKQLALRYSSFLARDIDEAAFGPDGLSTVVTAPTSVHLYLMKDMRDTILAGLNTKSRPEAKADVNAYASQEMKNVSERIKTVEGEIEDVKHEIQEVDDKINVILTAKHEGWQMEHDQCLQTKLYLLDKERHLYGIVKLLQEKMLLLLKLKQHTM